MRGAMAVLASTAAGAVLLAGSPVAAQVSPPPAWQGQWDSPTWTFDDASSHPITGWISHVGFQPVTVTVRVASSERPASCADPSTGSSSSQSIDGSRTRQDFTLGFIAECNGTYVMGAVGSVSSGCDVPNTPPCSSDEVLTTVSVARPAPAVTGVAASPGADHSVTVSWDGFATTSASSGTPAPKDLTGFEVTRTDIANGTSTTFSVDDPAASSYRDTSLPAGAGTYQYAVASRRFNTTSTPAAADKVTVAAAPAGGTTTTAPAANVTPNGSTAGAPGAPSSGAAGSGGTGGASRTARNPGAPSATVPSGFDAEGFSTDLPYEAEPGGVAAKLPSGEGGGFDVAGAGLLVPFAVALLLAVWALHILYVTKSARDADEALALLPVELE